jgi:putative PIN family toxin of toxin-antitoxin system
MKADNRLLPSYAQVVVDTNVIISAALSTRGAPAVLLRKILTQGQLVFSTATFAALTTRLRRAKFDAYLTPQERELILRDLAATARWCEPTMTAEAWCRDPQDDAFIALALGAQVTRLVAGDDDLLCLDPVGDLRLLTARQALDELEADR